MQQFLELFEEVGLAGAPITGRLPIVALPGLAKKLDGLIGQYDCLGEAAMEIFFVWVSFKAKRREVHFLDELIVKTSEVANVKDLLYLIVEELRDKAIQKVDHVAQ